MLGKTAQKNCLHRSPLSRVMKSTRPSLYIKRGKVSARTYVRPYVRHAGRGQLSSKWRHNENGAASAVGARCDNESDVLMIIAGLWKYGDWRHVVTGCNALVFLRSTVYSATANYNFWKSACRRSKRQNAERWPLTATFKVHTQTHEWYTTLQRRLIVTRLNTVDLTYMRPWRTTNAQRSMICAQRASRRTLYDLWVLCANHR